jgi:hypothetical protein
MSANAKKSEVTRTDSTEFIVNWLHNTKDAETPIVGQTLIG